MYKNEISLDTPEKAKALCQILRDVEPETTLSSGRYVVDAKSILGIFTLNLNKPVTLTIDGYVDDAILNNIKEYEVA